MTQGYLAGFAYGLLWYYDSTGAAIGQGATLANGATSNAYVLFYPKTAGLDYSPPGDLDIQAGDKDVTSIAFGNSRLRPFDLVIADLDTTLVTLITGSTLNTGNSQFDKFSINPNLTTPRSFGLCLQQRFQKTNGDEYYHILFIPKALLSFHHGAMGFRAEADTVLRVRPAMASKAHTGQDFTSATNNLNFTLENNKTDHYSYLSPYALNIVSYRSDASATTYTSSYRPVSATITVNATQNDQHKNGVATALTSFSVTTGVATLAAAGSAADLFVMTHTTQFVTP